MDDVRLLVFAKAPVPGEVKTRLIAALGAEGAARFHTQLVRRTIVTALQATGPRVELWCAPDCEHPFFASCAAEFSVGLYAQTGGGLGERMANAAGSGLQRAHKVLLIGTDCPALTPAYLDSAAAALANGNEVIIGPAEDGGYVLIGLSRPVPQIFTDISWGTERVLAQTRARLLSLGLRWDALATLWDVDDAAGLSRLLRELDAGTPSLT
jgi:uncharacterized protein